MNCFWVKIVIVFCVLTVTTKTVALADTEDDEEQRQTGGDGTDPETTGRHLHTHNQHQHKEQGVYPATENGPQNNTNESSAEAEEGPPDSHEAMNNREMLAPSTRAREKRSYEFLMGLINNNSKYEVTKIDLTSTKNQLHQPQEQQQQRAQDGNKGGLNASASELLLELMVKIAAHPDHWDKVHDLLQKIDNDLLSSRKLVSDLETAKIKIEPKSSEVAEQPQIIPIMKKIETLSKNKSTEDRHNSFHEKNQWPTFQENDEPNPEPMIQEQRILPSQSPSTTSMESHQHRWSPNNNDKDTDPLQGPQKSFYPKTFAYHRVTGRPLYLNKNPKAYIAVSVIAPKPLNSRSNAEDLILEKELRQLKPWTHNQNLKNMASMRSRWVIQTSDEDKIDTKKEDPVAP